MKIVLHKLGLSVIFFISHSTFAAGVPSQPLNPISGPEIKIVKVINSSGSNKIMRAFSAEIARKVVKLGAADAVLIDADTASVSDIKIASTALKNGQAVIVDSSFTSLSKEKVKLVTLELAGAGFDSFAAFVYPDKEGYVVIPFKSMDRSARTAALSKKNLDSQLDSNDVLNFFDLTGGLK